MAERDESPSVVERVRDAATSAGRRGETLPGEPTLAEALGVSRPTVREALVRLEAEGLIRRRKGADTIVNPGAVEMVARFDQQVEYADLLRGAGFEPSVEVLEAGVRGLSVEAAEQLEREPGARALRTVKRWRADGRAVMVAVDVVAALPGEEDRLAGLDPTCGLFELVRQLTGDVVEWELAWPGAELLRAPVRGWLEADRNQAVLTLDLVGITRRAHRAYHALEYHVPGAVPSGFVRTVRS